MKYIALLLLSFLTSCTLSFTNVDTHGSASDIVDSDPVNDVKPATEISLPVAPL